MRREINTVVEARAHAARRLPPILFDFIDGGSGDEVTMRANEAAFRDVHLVPMAGVAAPAPDLSTQVLGTSIDLPILLAPCGGLSLVHSDGQQGVCDAASAAGTLTVVSALCGNELDVNRSARSSSTAHWFQLYKLGGRGGAELLIEQAARFGYGALVVTLDSPVVGRKDRDLRHGGIKPGGATLTKVDARSVLEFAPKVIRRPRWLAQFARAGFPVGHPGLDPLIRAAEGSASVDDVLQQWRAEPAVWDDLLWIRQLWKGPLVVKGILQPEEARRAADLGADAVVVSNHGGRQLDRSPSTLSALPGVVAAVGDSIDVLLDSGVRRGVDAALAVAMGARAVLIGRPYLYGLSLGQRGVEQVLEVFRAELANAMTLMGCASVKDLDQRYLAGCKG